MKPLLIFCTLLALSLPAHADDLTSIGCSPWLKDGETCVIRSWGGNWNPETVANLMASRHIMGRVDICLSDCVLTMIQSPASFCLEPNARLAVHLAREYAGKWANGRWYEEVPRRVVSASETDIGPLRAYIVSQGGWKPATLNDRGEPTDWIEIPHEVALKVWRPCL